MRSNAKSVRAVRKIVSGVMNGLTFSVNVVDWVGDMSGCWWMSGRMVGLGLSI